MGNSSTLSVRTFLVCFLYSNYSQVINGRNFYIQTSFYSPHLENNSFKSWWNKLCTYECHVGILKTFILTNMLNECISKKKKVLKFLRPFVFICWSMRNIWGGNRLQLICKTTQDRSTYKHPEDHLEGNHHHSSTVKQSVDQCSDKKSAADEWMKWVQVKFLPQRES